MDLLKTKSETEWYPHGCVRLDLSELWLGQTSLEFYVSVVPCHANEPASGSRRTFIDELLTIIFSGRSKMGKRISSAKHLQIQQGDFLSNGTQMKVLVRLAQPLVRPIEHQPLSNQLISTPINVKFHRNSNRKSCFHSIRFRRLLELFSFFHMTIRNF